MCVIKYIELHMKIKYSCTLIAVLVVLVLIFGLFKGLTRSPQQSLTEEQYILSKLSSTSPSDLYAPVLFYKKDDRGNIHFLGSGTRIVSNGYIMTAEHLFSQYTNEEPSAQILLKDLRPLGNTLSENYGVLETIVVAQIRNARSHYARDAVIVTTGRAKKIPLISTIPHHLEINGSEEWHMVNPMYFTSLVSGERIPVLATSDPSGGPRAFILLHSVRSGESGTGLVDSDGNLYVITAQFDDSADTREKFKLKSGERISVAIGAFRF